MIQGLRVQQFRSYSDASFEFEPGVNIVVGPNASGKTNLLEAILVLSHGKSYRAKDRDLIKQHADWARIDGLIDKHPRTFKLQIHSATHRAQKIFEINETIKKRLTLADTIPTVLFEPTDLQLLNGSPRRRRDFLDALLARTEPGFASLLRTYERVLLQRNALLKQKKVAHGELFVWNVRLSEAGGRIIESRTKLTKQINQNLSSYYQTIAHEKKKITATYQTSVHDNFSSRLLTLLEKNTQTDNQKGFTSVGPHRDDMVLLFDGKPVGDVASRGEVRTLVLGLKVLELSLVENARKQKPLLLLDDVFSELDGARRKALTEFLNGYQTFITTTDADVVIEHFMKTANVLALA